jgi:hypothetical protein
MTKFVGVDQSFAKSAVWVEDDETGEFWFKVFSRPRGDTSVFTTVDASEDLAWDITEWLLDPKGVGFSRDTDRIALEQMAFGGVGNVAKDLAILIGLMISTFKNGDLGVQPYLAPIGQVKKLATGRGNKVSKKEMYASLPEEVQEAIQKAGYKVSTGKEDLADAYFICQWLRREVTNV